MVSIVTNGLSLIFAYLKNDYAQQLFTTIGMSCLFIYLGRLVYEIERSRYQRFKDEQKAVWDKLK